MSQGQGKVARHLLAVFLNTGTGEAPEWSICGDGVTEQTIDYGAETTDEQYVHQKTASSSVNGYKLSIPTPMTAYKGDPVFGFVDEVRKRRAILGEAETDVLLVYLYEEPEDGAYEAEKSRCAIKINSFGGPANEPAKLDFDILLSGDPVYGAFVPESRMFTAGA